jgi:hypothetical protein
MDTCAHHVGPREYVLFPAIEYKQLFTHLPISAILRSSGAKRRGTALRLGEWLPKPISS